MYLRDTDFPTLADVAGKAHDKRRTWKGSSTAVDVHLDRDDPENPSMTGVIVLGRKEVPATQAGLQALAEHYDIPYKFLERLPNDERQFLLSHRIQRSADVPLVLRYTDKGIDEAYNGTQVRVMPEAMVEEMLKIFPENSPVSDWWSNSSDFRLDVMVPEGFKKGIGGDKKVGDITHGGVRVGQNRKQNLTPWVQPFMFRLACTNGMEVPDFGLKIDARGLEDHQIVSFLGAEARRAFDRVDDDIKHFYDLRSVKTDDDHTGLFRRMARESGLPDRTVGQMENTLMDALQAEDEVTMFHLVNHMTNQANDPGLANRPNARRALQQAGGQMISDHAARCERCHARLS